MDAKANMETETSRDQAREMVVSSLTPISLSLTYGRKGKYGDRDMHLRLQRLRSMKLRSFPSPMCL